MASLNKVQLIGNCGRDPEIRYLPSGQAVASISVATTSKRKDKQSGENIESTEWHRVKFFGRLAEIAGEYLKKGGQVYVEGKLRTDEYEKDGIKRYSTDIIADEMQMLGSKGGGAGSGGGEGSSGGGYSRERGPARGPQSAPARSAPAAPAAGSDNFDEDEIPF